MNGHVILCILLSIGAFINAAAVMISKGHISFLVVVGTAFAFGALATYTKKKTP
jgi:hypothetical protein